MNLPKETAEIFDVLSRGHFISHRSDLYRKLFDVLDSNDNFDLLVEYFSHIQFKLERADNYFYFSKKVADSEISADIEQKIDRFSKYIDILDFFGSLNNRLEVGIIVTPSDITLECQNNPILQKKVQSIKTNTNSDSITDKIKNILEELRKESFLEKIDKDTEKYLVLDSFAYLQTLIYNINPKNYVE